LQQLQQQRHPRARAALFDVNGLVKQLIARQLLLLQGAWILVTDSQLTGLLSQHPSHLSVVAREDVVSSAAVSLTATTH